MLKPADITSAFQYKAQNVEQIPCEPPNCFVGSYPPVPKAGEVGPFNVNTYLLQPNRKFEVIGPVTVRSEDINRMSR